MARILFGAGFTVSSLSTSAVEAAQPLGTLAFLRECGLDVEIDRRGAVGKGRPVFRFAERGVTFTVLDTGPLHARDWEMAHGPQLTRLLEHTLRTLKPDLVLTYGGSPPEVSRRQMCRDVGATVVFCLQNAYYLHPLAFEHVDAVVTPSQFLAQLYAQVVGLESTPIPPPMERAEIFAPQRRPIALTYINPTPAKGIFVFVRVADMVLEQRPETEIDVIQARGVEQHVHEAASIGGINLRRHKGLRFLPTMSVPRDCFARSRAVLVPSVCSEAFGRIAAEALLNGIPPIVSDRGGLTQAVNGAGFAIPLPRTFTPSLHQPLSIEAATPWVRAILRLHDDQAFYDEQCAKALHAGGIYEETALARRYAAYFERLAVEKPRGPVVLAERVTVKQSPVPL